MPIATNHARERLSRGELALGFGVHHLRGAAVGMLAAAAGYDWLFLDMEHGVMSLEAAPRSRSPRSTPASADRTGAEWRIFDRHEGARQRRARHRDAACRHRRRSEGGRRPAPIPAGRASLDGRPPFAYGLRSVSTGEAAQALNAANLTVVMLETPTAIANAEEIAAVPGVDVLLIGTNDLCAEMGIPGDFGHPDGRAPMRPCSRRASGGQIPRDGRRL